MHVWCGIWIGKDRRMIGSEWVIVTIFVCFYYLVLLAVFAVGDYTRKVTLLMDLIPFFGIFRVGIPALFRALCEMGRDVQNAWRKLQ